jgi:hypothetical protein
MVAGERRSRQEVGGSAALDTSDGHNIQPDALNTGPIIYMGICYTGMREHINDANSEVQFGQQVRYYKMHVLD